MRFSLITKWLLPFFILLSFNSNAQLDPLYSQYMFNPMVLNPAYAGLHEMGMATITHREQWTGVTGRPIITGANFHSALPVPKMGAGITLAQERFGITTNTELQAVFAYHLRFKENKLNFGVSGNYNRYKVAFNNRTVDDGGNYGSWLNLKEEDTSIPTTDVDQSEPNFGFGAMYTTKKYFVGLSIPKILEVDLEKISTNKSFVFIRHYYLTGGYLIKLYNGAILKPSFLARFAQSSNTPFNVDLNTSLLLKEKIWLGASLRTSTVDQFISSLVLMGQLQVNDYLKTGIAFDFGGFTEVRATKYGSVELMLNFNFPVFGSQAVQEILY